MSLLLQNSRTNPDDEIDFIVRHEHIADGVVVPALEGTARVPVREVGQFHYVWLTAEEDGSNPGVRVLSDGEPHERDLGRIVATWGTLPDNPRLMRQHQSDRIVEFDRGYVPDRKLTTVMTYSRWEEIPMAGMWPPALCSAIYFSLDVTLVPGSGAGYAGAVVAAGQRLGVHASNPFTFRGRMGGIVPSGSGVSAEWIRIPVPLGSSAPQIKVGQGSQASVAIAGYELVPT